MNISIISISLISITLLGCISNPKPSALNGGVFLTIETKSNQQIDLISHNLFFQPIADNRIIKIEDLQLKNKFEIEFGKRGFKFDNELKSESLIVQIKKARISVPFNRNNGNILISNGIGYNISIYKLQDSNILEIFSGNASVISSKGNLDETYEKKLIETLTIKYGKPDFSAKKWLDNVNMIDEIVK